MANIIYSDDQETIANLTHDQRQFVYNTLDCCVTTEVLEKIKPQLDENSSIVYKFSRALQGPVLDMMMRGMAVNLNTKKKLEDTFSKRKIRLQFILDSLANAVWGKDLNANSPHQCKAFFYEHMGLPKQYKFAQGQRKVSTDREALEKLRIHFYAEPVCNAVLAVRDTVKKLSVIRKGLDEDLRIRTSYGIAGTETGRFSSSTNVWGTGDNLQNWEALMRQMIVPDPGKKFAYIDLEQAESDRKSVV